MAGFTVTWQSNPTPYKINEDETCTSTVEKQMMGIYEVGRPSIPECFACACSVLSGCQACCDHAVCSTLKENHLTFHTNAPSFPCLLGKRGLDFARPGEFALFSAYRALGTGPPSRRVEADTDVDPTRRALIELRRMRICQDLSDKKLLALHLQKSQANRWAPRTFLSPAELDSFSDLKKHAMLFFLKHAQRDRNEGVSVYLGVEACYKAWLSLPPEQQLEFVVQQEVPDVLLDEGRKITLRIYILLLLFVDEGSRVALALARRKFICRLHPRIYDAADPDPARHVHSTLDVFKDVDGFSSTSWHHSDAVWPAIMEMFQAGY